MARKKAGDNQERDKNTDSAGGVENTPNAQADHDSIAIGGIRIGGDVSGSITIGHGYTAEQVSLLLEQITSKYQRKPFDGRCPYKGLEVFEEEDAELFFGRERLVHELVNRVKGSRTVFITGPSGSGKSSLVRAGLLHTLKQGAIKDSERWLYEIMKPGREPLKDLSLAFSRLKSPDLADYFQAHANETDILHRCAESVLSGRKNQRFVLFIDQFEEVFTQISQEEERLAFLNMLAYAGTVEQGRVIVLFAMRSDFVSNCATYPMINELLSQQFRQIGAMQPEELVAAIALPARHVGLPIEDELIARIINDMKGEPGALPLMQFALKDLFDSQQEKGGVIALRLEDYLKHGGIHKSLERHADKSFAELTENEQQLARSIFSGLIEIGRGTQDTRRTALFDELIPADAKSEEVGAIVRKLADARLIITDEQAGKDTVTISHEKLIDAWPWLKKLVNENRDVIALQNEIASDAKEWEDHQRDPSYLYTGARLANAREQLDAKKLVLSGSSYEFVKAGQAQQQRNRRTRVLGIAIPIGVIFIVLILAYISTTNSANRAQLNAALAYAQQATAQAASTEAVAQNLVAQANAEEAQKQTEIALARQLAAQAQSINATRNSKQMIAVLLATHSMSISPSIEASQILLGNNFTSRSTALMSHDGSVYAVAFSPNGKYVASSSADNTVRVWQISTGQEIARLTHDDWVEPIAFSPDGKYVVSGSWDYTARVWEAATGMEIARMTHDHIVSSVAFSPDGKYVVSGSHDRTLRVWEPTTGQEIVRMTHDASVISVAFSTDGNYLVSGGADDTVRVWETITGKEITRIDYGDWVRSVDFSPDGNYIVAGGNGWLRVWETATGEEVASMTHGDITLGGGGGAAPSDRRWVDFSPDGKYIVSGGPRTARVWEAATGMEIARMAHDASVISVAFSPDGQYVVSGSVDGTGRVWDILTGQETARMTHDGGISWVAFSPNGNSVVSGGSDNTVRMWEALTGNEIVRRIPDIVSFGFNSVSSPDGKYIASGLGSDTIHIWELSTRMEVSQIANDGIVSGAFFSPDGKYVIVETEDNIARLWEISSGREIIPIIEQDALVSFRFISDGKYVLSESKDKVFYLWNAMTRKVITHITPDDGVLGIDVSPDANYFMSTACERVDENCTKITIHLWETMSGKEVVQMSHDMVVSTLGPFGFGAYFSPDGKYVVSKACEETDEAANCTKGSVRLWEIITGREVAYVSHEGDIFSVAFSPDGKYVVSGNSANTNGPTLVWESATGKEVARVNVGETEVSFSPDGKYVLSNLMGDAHQLWETQTGRQVILFDRYTTVHFSPDGKYVVSAGYDGTIRVWEVSTGREIAHMNHDSSVHSVAFSPDGKYVISGSADHTARVWDAMTGREIARRIHFEEVSSVEFSAEGNYAMSISGGDAYIWFWQPNDLIANACADLPRNLTRDEWNQYIGDVLPYEATCPNLPIDP